MQVAVAVAVVIGCVHGARLPVEGLEVEGPETFCCYCCSGAYVGWGFYASSFSCALFLACFACWLVWWKMICDELG